MKTRSDFVTNSSSSSFIAAFARVSDKKKAAPFIEKELLDMLNAKEEYDNDLGYFSGVKIVSGQDLLDEIERKNQEMANAPEWHHHNHTYMDDHFEIEGTWAGVHLTLHKDKIDPDALYYLFQQYGGGDDSDFWDEEYGEMDYNIDLSHFCPEFQDIYNKISAENGFADVQKDYGAGRDG